MESQRLDAKALVISALGMEEAEETIRAIRHGAVDAFVVEEPEGHRVYTLEGADVPYSVLVECMQQGAAMLDGQGDVVYCNPSMVQLLGVPRETAIGRGLRDFLDEADRSTLERLRNEALTGASEGEMQVRRPDGTVVSAYFSFQLLSRDKSVIGVLATDLTAEKAQVELAARLQRVQDEERRRIARELHDSVGQLLAAISMNISIVLSQSRNLDAMGQRAVSENSNLVQEVTREIRTISHLLHPPLLDVAGLVSALHWYVDGFSERSNIKVELDIPPDFARLPDEMELAIFRIVQECLTNIHRHSGSPTATLRIKNDAGRLLVQIEDKGKGIPADKQMELITSGRTGVGFGGMRERLRQLGGALEIQSEGEGTTVTAIFSVE
jgi:PAS domain S-box-containing protein